jgi:hypothetical protein
MADILAVATGLRQKLLDSSNKPGILLFRDRNGSAQTQTACASLPDVY